MENFFSNRLTRSYAVLILGGLLFWMRRQIFPTIFDSPRIPFDIGTISTLNSCYTTPTLVKCSDPLFILLTASALVWALWRGNLVVMIFAIILTLVPLAFYFMFAPIVMVAVMFLAIPILIVAGVRLVAPDVDMSELPDEGKPGANEPHY